MFYRFMRSVTAKNGAYVPAGLKFAGEVAEYLNKSYGLKLSFGVEMFGTPTLHWQFEVDALDKLTALNAKLMQDREYFAMLERAKDLWVDGSLHDRVVAFQA